MIRLNRINKILNIELVSLGAIDEALVKRGIHAGVSHRHPERGLKIILCHNHPSNLLLPSEADLDLTDRMKQVGNIIHIKVEDHMIFTLDEYSLLCKLNVGQKHRIRERSQLLRASLFARMLIRPPSMM